MLTIPFRFLTHRSLYIWKCCNFNVVSGSKTLVKKRSMIYDLYPRMFSWFLATGFPRVSWLL